MVLKGAARCTVTGRKMPFLLIIIAANGDLQKTLRVLNLVAMQDLQVTVTVSSRLQVHVSFENTHPQVCREKTLILLLHLGPKFDINMFLICDMSAFQDVSNAVRETQLNFSKINFVPNFGFSEGYQYYQWHWTMKLRKEAQRRPPKSLRRFASRDLHGVFDGVWVSGCQYQHMLQVGSLLK